VCVKTRSTGKISKRQRERCEKEKKSRARKEERKRGEETSQEKSQIFEPCKEAFHVKAQLQARVVP
jgi:hypothetical protein